MQHGGSTAKHIEPQTVDEAVNELLEEAQQIEAEWERMIFDLGLAEEGW